MRPTRWTWILGLLMLAMMALMYITAFVMGAEPVPLTLVLVVGIFACTGAVSGLRTSLPVHHPRVIDVAGGTAASAACLLMSRDMGIPPLVAISLVAIVIGVMRMPTGPLDARAMGAAYAGGFVGLIAPSITAPGYWVALAGAAAGLLWSLVGLSVYDGVGGRLGLVAFMASWVVYGIAQLLGEERTPVLVPEVRGMAHLAIIPVGAAGALVVWMLIQRRGWDFALASGLTSLLVCGVIDLAGLGALAPVLGTGWFGGTMVGLSTPKRLRTAGWVGLAGLVYGAYMVHFEGPLTGHVGVVGVTATIAVLCVMGIERVAGRAIARAPRPAGART